MTEVRAVQDMATPEFATFVQLAATVGARRGTLVALRWGDVDLGEGSSPSLVRSLSPRTGRSRRVRRQIDRTRSLWVRTRRKCLASTRRGGGTRRFVGVPFGAGCFVFSDDGVTHWSLAWPSHAWQRFSTRAGVARVRLHDLRHTAASQMFMAGVAISVVAERLGCTEANILRTYRHFIPGSDQEAAELMDRLLRGSPVTESAARSKVGAA